MKRKDSFFTALLCAILFALGASNAFGFTQPTQQFMLAGSRLITSVTVGSSTNASQHDSSLVFSFATQSGTSRPYGMIQRNGYPLTTVPDTLTLDVMVQGKAVSLSVSFLIDSSATPVRNSKDLITINPSGSFSTIKLPIPSPAGLQFTRLRLNVSTDTTAFSGQCNFYADNIRIGSNLLDACEYVKLPSGAVLSSPSNSATGVPQTVTLVLGKGQRTDSRRVVVTDTVGAILDTVLSGTDTTLTLYGLQTGKLYFWKVTNQNVLGSGADSPTWSFRTAYSVLVPPTVPVWDKPDDEINGALLDQQFAVFRDTTAGVSYRFQLLNSADSILGDTTKADTSIVPGSSVLRYNTQYKYRAKKVLGGLESDWTAVRTFRTIKRPPPPTPSIILPVEGATVSRDSVKIVIVRNGPEDTAAIFTYEWWTAGSTITGTTASDTSFVPTGIAYSVAYSVRVNSYYPGTDTTSAWSPTISFSTSSAPPMPPGIARLSSPTNGVTGVSNVATLSCSSATGVDSTRFRILIGGVVYKDTTVSGFSVAVTLPGDTTVFWQGQHRNSVGTGDWSVLWNFKTATPPSSLPNVPIIVKPLNGDTIRTGITRILYRRDSLATSTRIQVFLIGGEEVVDVSVVPGDTLYCSLLDNSYYVRAQNVNSLGTTDWSSLTNFRVSLSGQIFPEAPTLDGPAQDAIGLDPTATTLRWRNSGQSSPNDSFYVEISETSRFEVIIYQKTVPTPQLIVGSLSGTTTYYWRVRKISAGVVSGWSVIRNFTTTVITGINDGEYGTPDKFALAQNYPNPFNPTTTIRFAVPKSGRIAVIVYNILGQKVRILLDKQVSPGFHSVEFDGRDNNGNLVASGIYIYRLIGTDFNQTKKMMFVK